MSFGNTRSTTPAQKADSWGFRGKEAIAQARRENEMARQRREQSGVRRFYLKNDAQAEIVILDASFDESFGLYEHAIPGPGNNWAETQYEVSPISIGQEDPLTIYPVVNGAVSKPYFVQFLTILDLTPYTNKKGEIVHFTRKLLPIKASQGEDFKKLFDNAMKKHGTLRGFHLKLSRPPKGPISSKIGNPGTLDSLEYGFFTEKELVKNFGHPAVQDQQGKVIIPANGKLQPFDYMKVFKKPDPVDIRQRYGINPPLGSAQEEEEAWGNAAEEVLGDSYEEDALPSDLPDNDDPDLVQFA